MFTSACTKGTCKGCFSESSLMQVVPWVHPEEAALSQNPEWHLLFNTVDLGKMSYSHWVQKFIQEGSEQPFPPWPNTFVSKKVRMAAWLSYSLDLSSFLLLHCHVLLTQKKTILEGEKKSSSLISIPYLGLGWLSRGFWHKGLLAVSI